MMLPMMLIALSGCGPDQETLDKLSAAEEELARTRDDLERAERERDAYKARVERLSAELKDQRTREIYTRLGISPGQEITATLDTSMGSITCELLPQYAPMTVLNFVELAEGSREWTDPRTGMKVQRPLYNGTIFHRVIPGFMIQGGDPLGRGTGGPGYRFEDEIAEELKFDGPGLLAMANSGPDTNGSQFFITLAPTEHLNGKHTIFGRDCEPMEVAEAIAGVTRDRRDKPETDVVIRTIQIGRDQSR